jgi:hypothetical protein
MKRTTSMLALLLSALAFVLLTNASAGLASVPSAAPAALSFAGPSYVGATGTSIWALAAGDLDNDGHPDLVSGDTGHVLTAWRNDGTPFSGAWPTNTLGTAPGDIYAIALGDLDHDGWLDVASGGVGGPGRVQVWRNDGAPFAGGLSAVTVDNITSTVYAIAIADLDQDGHLDLVTGDMANRVIAWRNDGGPFVGTWVSTTIGYGAGPIWSVAAGDLDGDGYPDIAAGDAGSRVTVWRNDRTPFSGAWAAGNVAFGPPDALAVVRSVALADLDADGDLDIVAGCHSAEDNELLVLENNGAPFSGKWPQHDVGATSASIYKVVVSDLDQDGDLDIATGSGATPAVRVWENSGSPFGGLWSGSNLAGSLPSSLGLVAADLDHDGDDDIVASAVDSLSAWSNTRPVASLGNWTEVAQPLPAPASLAVAAADLNYDGKLDLAAGASSGLLVWNGDGGYTWTANSGGLPTSGAWNAVAWGQHNSMGFRDLVAAAAGQGLRAYQLQQAGSNWVDVSTGLSTTGTFHSATLADGNHDYKPDLAAGGSGVGVRVWQGNGSSWTFRNVLSGTVSFCGVAWGDVNHDGNEDIVAASCGANGVSVWTGAGDFSFKMTSTPAASGSYGALAVGDVNHDGHLDIAGAPQSGGITLWLGNGAGAWAPQPILSATVTVNSLFLDDFDRDGNLDLLAGTAGAGVLVWRGNGAAGWTLADLNLPDKGAFLGAVFGRVDGDAALDIVAAEGAGSGLHVWTAHEPPPGGWDSFLYDGLTPSQWSRSRVVTGAVRVADAGSGLDVSTAQYRYSKDGGSTWVGAGWTSAPCSGADGTLTQQVITATAVDFGQDSAGLNAIQFQVSDLSGLAGTSPIYYVKVDSTPPVNPTHIGSTSHQVSTWNASASLTFTWTPGADATSGMWGYSWLLDTSPASTPDTTADTSGTTAVASAPGTGNTYYFHLRAGDAAGNWSAPAHLGPYYVDITAPNNATDLHSHSHVTQTWSSDPTVSVNWSAGSDVGSGTAGYWYDFNTTQASDPVAHNTTGLGVTGEALSTGNNWYFNVRARDQVGNRAGGAAHLGPFYIDTTAPTSVVSSTPSVHAISFDIAVTAGDGAGQSGVASTRVDYREKPAGAWAWLATVDPAHTSASFTGLAGHTYCFRSRATDNAGNVEAWPASVDGDACTAIATDLTVTALEATQVIQNLANGVPLVQDKETWVRAYVNSADLDVDDVSGLLYGTRGGAPLAGSPLASEFAITGKTSGGVRDELHDALLFRLPATWRNGAVQLRAEVNPGHSVAEDDYSNNERIQNVSFQRTNTLCIDMVRVHLHPHTASIDDAGFWDLVEFVRRTYPVANVSIYRGHTIYPYWHGFTEWTLDDDFNWVLEKLWDYNNGHDDPDECAVVKYFGMVHPESLDHGSPGIGYRPGSEAAGVMSTYNAGQWPNPWGGRIIAHELGHNFGREHVQCTGSEAAGGSVDWSYPYPITNPCRIANDGDPATYNGWFWPVDGSDFEIITATEAADLMSYNWKRFPSDYTYRALLGGVDLASSVQTVNLPQTWTEAGEYLRASGIITLSQNQAWLAPFYRQDSAKQSILQQSYLQSLSASSAYSLALLGAGDSLLYAHTFSPTVTADLGGFTDTVFFGEVFPYNTGAERIALYRDGVELGSRPVSPNSPSVTIQAPQTGASFASGMDIAWTGTDPDGGGPLDYSVYYSGDNGVTWHPVATGIYSASLHLTDLKDLPGGAQARVRVVASDGVNTGQAVSGPFSVDPHAPEPHITSPRANATISPDAAVVLRGLAIDTEDGPITYTERLTWTVDISGAVGTGAEIGLPSLPPGKRTITLTASDSDGQSASQTITVFVGYRLYLPLIFKATSSADAR